jgi:glycosyltransferase involved in cell wall biosynthesis
MTKPKEKAVLFLGPKTPPVTGQAMAFTQVYEHYTGPKILINTSTSNNDNFSKLYKYIYTIMKTICCCLFLNYGRVYFTGSRSLAGGIRDILMIWIVSMRSTDIRIVNHLHGATLVPFLQGMPKVLRNAFVRAYRRIDLNIVLLPSMGSEIETFDPLIKTKVISNSYDSVLDHPSVDSLDKGKKNNEIRLGYFSNLMFSKGIVDLLQAFTKLSVDYSNISLYIAGDFFGDYCKSRKEIETIVHPYLDHPRIKYLGVVQGAKKQQFLEGIDVFVLASFHKGEAFPISIIEAMRCGAAIVSTRHNYLPEIVTPEIGLLAKPGDVDDLSNKIQYYIDHPDEMYKTGKMNCENAKLNFSPELYKKEVLKSILASKLSS